MDWARDSPRFRAADWASGSLEPESPYPVTEMVPFPRLAAKAFTSSAAGCDRLEARSGNTMVADVPAEGAGIGVGARLAAGAGPAAAGRGGGATGNAGGGPAGGATAAAGGVAIVAGGVARAAVPWSGVVGVAAVGASSGVLCTGLRGAGDGGAGGAVAAGIDALATGAAGELVFAGGVTPGGGGGGAVPTPNRLGDAEGDDGSASGADWAACWALVRSATSESVSFFIASASGGSGLTGTVDIFGYG